jgi:hypothetical protein
MKGFGFVRSETFRSGLFTAWRFLGEVFDCVPQVSALQACWQSAGSAVRTAWLAAQTSLRMELRLSGPKGYRRSIRPMRALSVPAFAVGSGSCLFRLSHTIGQIMVDFDCVLLFDEQFR